jgi:hypothetical protein
MSETNWRQDGVDRGWVTAEGIGAIRCAVSYKQGGWWFLPAWSPDSEEFDVGPFSSKHKVVAEAERLFASQISAHSGRSLFSFSSPSGL